MLNAEQNELILAVAPTPPRERKDLIFLIEQAIPDMPKGDSRAIAYGTVGALGAMTDEEYSRWMFV